MKFLETIRVQLDEVACLGVFEMCQSPSMGEFTRQGFVDGWKAARYVPSILHRDDPSILTFTQLRQ